jgi:hypothetical protein
MVWKSFLTSQQDDFRCLLMGYSDNYIVTLSSSVCVCVARLIAEEGGVPQDHRLAASPPGADMRCVCVLGNLLLASVICTLIRFHLKV